MPVGQLEVAPRSFYDVDVRTVNYYKKIQSVRESGMDRDIFYRETVQMNNDRKQKRIDFGAEALTEALVESCRSF